MCCLNYFIFGYLFIPTSIVIIIDTLNVLQNDYKDVLYVRKHDLQNLTLDTQTRNRTDYGL